MMNQDFAQQLIERTNQLSLNILRKINSIDLRTIPDHVIAKQLTRSACSIGSNYKAACRSKSAKDFLYKLKIVEEETDESIHWINTLQNLRDDISFTEELKELNEIIRIIVKSIDTTRKRIKATTTIE